MNAVWAIAAAAAYAAALFGLASWTDRRTARATAGTAGPLRGTGLVYALSLAVYCTSWTFFGAVGTAARDGWDYLPIYLGPLLLFTLGLPLVRRLVRAAKAQNASSIADFLSARYGKSQGVATAVTVSAVIAALPYIALQLKSVAMSFAVLTDGPGVAGPDAGDASLMVALALAAFAILFGTRNPDMTASNRGMIWAIAAESAFKLAALVAVAGFAWAWLAMPEGAAQQAPIPPPDAPFGLTALGPARLDLDFITLTLLAVGAMLCLPRQFHVMVVESDPPGDRRPTAGLRTARWLVPIYMALTALVVPPIAAAGMALGPAGGPADLFVLSLPVAQGQDLLALIAFLGGFSAATGMVVVSSVALSNMITSDLVAPMILRDRRYRQPTDPAASDRPGPPLARTLLASRRLAILGILLAAHLFQQGMQAGESLAQQGLLAFAAVAQFTPALIGGLFWRRGNRIGVLVGLGLGMALWFVMLMLPAYTGAAAPLGPWPGLDPLTLGVAVALAANAAGYVAGSLLARPRLVDRVQAAAVVAAEGGGRPRLEGPRGYTRAEDLITLMERCLGEARAREAIGAFELVAGRPYAADDPVDGPLMAFAEGQLARLLGASSARLLIGSALEGRSVPLEDVVALIDETSQKLQFNRELLQATLEHLSQGVSVVDQDMRLVAWNTTYKTMFALPDHLVTVGRPIADIIRYNVLRSGVEVGELDAHVARRLDHMRAGNAHAQERPLPDGRVIRLQGNPMPGGGYVTSFSDVTADKHTQNALQDAKATLEQRVAARTAEAEAARIQAERATQSKTRFLAAASHDLLQPLNAARLFTSALEEEVRGRIPAAERLAASIDQSIASADRLLKALLDISKLDAGGLQPSVSAVPLSAVLDGLTNEFSALAHHKGLTFRTVPTRAWVTTDRDLLQSVLQNLISNAVRYTPRGKVLVGCRRRGDTVAIQVLDTGPGIPADKRDEIFEEFRRLDDPGDGTGEGSEKGLGLGLAITRRIASLLGHGLALASTPGRGTCFTVSVPVAQAAEPRPLPIRRAGGQALRGLRVLCLDNDPDVLDGLAALLDRWQATPLLAADEAAALAACAKTGPPDLMLLDYRLDGGLSGPVVYDRLAAAWGHGPPAALVSAEHSAEVTDAAAARGLPVLGKPVPPASLRALLVQLTRTAAE
ncbi:hypothetical protein CCR80_06400 [Rhodothalassium salexigens]|uniref:hybrid sensor histidine kinase/response regulator n=1 Tax=Rhodothalassium salexigens TaxID=1086 RepID=UPI00191496AD|nr:hybrid sensor histidine kinase/response regulator [Rhodothalassium salexigens]MBK5920668.1 hypothetical protein [Rhodothalassium salexigens]